MEQGAIKRVAVIGAGLMGYGIALEFARFGYPVGLYDIKDSIIEQSMKNIRRDLDLMVEAQVLAADKVEDIYQRVRPTLDLKDAVSGIDYVVEAVPDRLELKQDVFAQLDELCPPPAILATNTTALRVADIAAKAKHPERILLTHYFEPPHITPLVEVGTSEKTDSTLVDTVTQFLRKMRKKVVVITVDVAGGVGGTRLQAALLHEVYRMGDEWGYTHQMIDDIITYGFGRRMAWTGHFHRMDLIGLDFLYNSAHERGSAAWKPIEERVERGELGMKSGKGFYDWPPDVREKFMRRYYLGLLWLLKQDMENNNI